MNALERRRLDVGAPGEQTAGGVLSSVVGGSEQSTSCTTLLREGVCIALLMLTVPRAVIGF